MEDSYNMWWLSLQEDSDLAGGGSSFRCLRSAYRGRMEISVKDEIVSAAEHNNKPEPEVKKARQITA